jgi:DNA-binding NtrC family response regulator/pSer/pThr/pTyr-binding forkhead associated (FHA) protein
MSETGTFKCALPPQGELTIGRDELCNVRVDDDGVSRHHATLRVGSRLEIIDLGSRNGTLIGSHRVQPNVPVEVSLGDAIRIGDTVLVVQETAAGATASRFSSRGAFEARLDQELVRARERSSTLALMRVVVHRREGEASQGGTSIPLDRLLADALRPVDLFSTIRPGDFEIALPDVTSTATEGIAAGIRQKLADGGYSAAIGIAVFPDRGSTRPALQRAAAARLVDAPAPTAPGVDLVTLKKVVPTLDRIAAGTINVLILGETGVGKEVVAHAIHSTSPRSDAPIVCLNCCALSETLLESELFGHERGAFTGALRAKPGLLEAAEGGTLFLDEVGEMSLGLQAKFLRVLEQREVTRVGGLKPRPIDVRIVSATNRDLQADIDLGRFRQDLFFRLNGVSVVVPPLRERLDELEPLTRRFVTRAAELARRDVPTISPEVFAILRSWSWPGNIRELRNIAERAVLLCAGDVIQLQHLPVDKLVSDLPSRRGSIVPTRHPPPLAAENGAGTRIPPLPELDMNGIVRNTHEERARIVEVLRMCQGNQTKAAQVLGISRRTLVSRLTEYDLPRPRKPVSAQSNRSEKGRP